jgi:ribosomal protein S18 acetylase RimI-like enzyme
MLLFDRAPEPGDGPRWERRFEAEFAGVPTVAHRTFAWDQADGSEGAAETEFGARGYELERSAGLVAAPAEIRPHPRENRGVIVRALDPAPGADASAWEQVVELQVVGRAPGFSEVESREFSARRLFELRDLFRNRRGAWYVAEREREVVGSCGIVVTNGRGRYQTVDTAEAHRRQGICSRLLVAAAAHAARAYGARQLVIAADPAYHALGLYESLGFRLCERVCGAMRRPPPAAACAPPSAGTIASSRTLCCGDG